MESWQDIQKEIAEAGPKITTPGVSPHDYVWTFPISVDTKLGTL